MADPTIADPWLAAGFKQVPETAAPSAAAAPIAPAQQGTNPVSTPAQDPWAGFRPAPASPAIGPQIDIEFPGQGTVADPRRQQGGSGGGADDYFSPNREAPVGPQGALADIGWQFPQGVNEGLDAAINLPYNLMARWPAQLAGYDLPEGRYARRFNSGRPAEGMAGRLAHATGEAIGASAIPEGVLLGNAERMASMVPNAVRGATTPTRAIDPATGMLADSVSIPGYSVPRAMVQHVGETVAGAPGTTVAIDALAAAGYGVGHEYAKENEYGPLVQGLAGIAGSFAPIAGAAVAERGARYIYDALSPTFERWKASSKEFAKEHGVHSSAEGGGRSKVDEFDTPGGRAAAIQVLANYLRRGGYDARGIEELRQAGSHAKSFEELLNIMEQAERSSLYYGGGKRGDGKGSYGANVLAPVDVLPIGPKVAGSAMRANEQAEAEGKAFMYARQTGQPPINPLPPNANLPTREWGAAPVTGRQALDKSGTTYGMPLKDPVPMGQGERMLDFLKRAFVIKDSEWHGHASSAGRQEDAILDAAAAGAQKDYKAAIDASKQTVPGQNYDAGVEIADRIEGVINQWRSSEKWDDLPSAVKVQLERAFQAFAPNGSGLRSLKLFDNTKRIWDDKIGGWVENANRTYRTIGHEVNNFKNDMLAAIDAVETNNVGALYAKARDNFSSHMEGRRAFRLGLELFNDKSLGAEVTADAYNAIAGEGNQKLFRLGSLGSYEKYVMPRARTEDITRFFDNMRIEKVLRAVIPRTETGTGRDRIVAGAPAIFSDRPQRFGRKIGDEKRMINTRNATQGGSPTQKYNVADRDFEDMVDFVDKSRHFPGATELMTKAAMYAFNKVFGYRQDTAAQIVRLLFTADPETQALVMASIRARLGDKKFSMFADMLRQQGETMAPARAMTNTEVSGGNTPPPKPQGKP